MDVTNKLLNGSQIMLIIAFYFKKYIFLHIKQKLEDA